MLCSKVLSLLISTSGEHRGAKDLRGEGPQEETDADDAEGEGQEAAGDDRQGRCGGRGRGEEQGELQCEGERGRVGIERERRG